MSGSHHSARLPAICIILTCLLVTSASAQDMARSLTPGEPMRGTLAQKGKASFSVDIDEGLFVYGEVNQITVDVVVTITSPDGKDEWTFDNPARGPEPFEFDTKTPGQYTIAVTPFEQGSGDFAIEVMRAEPVAPMPDERVGQIMAKYDKPDGPGGVVAVTKGGKIIFSKGFGLANIEFDAPNTPSTPYHLASVSKQFTAFAIALLADEGKLSLEDDVRKFIPELHDYGHTITLRHLLNHTSGLRDQWNLFSMTGGRMDDVIRTEDLMRLIVDQRELNFAPGDEFLYCNSGYMLLAETVARVSGMSYKAFMQERVFGPLGMMHTHIHDNHEHIVKGRAYSYRNGDDGIANAVLSYANSGATSQFSSAEDLARWVDTWRTHTVGSDAVFRAMQQRGVLNNGDTIPYALGVSIEDYKGQRRISHSGGDAGFRTYVAIFPDLDAAVITLGNDGLFNSRGIALRTIESFFPDAFHESPSPAPEASSDDTPKPEPWKPSLDELKAFEGRYFSEELETFYTISLKDSTLMGHQRRVGDITLTPQTEKNTFRGNQFVLQQVRFDGDEMFVSNGRVRDLRMKRVKRN